MNEYKTHKATIRCYNEFHLITKDGVWCLTCDYFAKMAEWEPIFHERRIIVKGWTGSRTWTNVHLYSNGLQYFIDRIESDKNNEPWQPHVTKVTVEARYVTPWQETESYGHD